MSTLPFLLPAWLRAIGSRAPLRTCYATSWRRGEVLGLTKAQVDFKEGTITIYDSKNGKGRIAYMTQAMRDALERCCAGKQPGGPRDGKRVGYFYKTWSKVLKAAGIKRHLVLHSLRNTGIRNMVRSGISEHVAMTISGHKTRSVFDCYDIVSTKDLRKTARSLDARQNSYSSAGFAD